MKYLYDIIIMAVDRICKNISKLECWKMARIGQDIFCPKVDQKTINETNNTVLSFKDTLKRFVKNLIDRKASMYNYEYTKKTDDALPSYDKYKHKLFALFSAKYAHYYVEHEKHNEGMLSAHKGNSGRCNKVSPYGSNISGSQLQSQESVPVIGLSIDGTNFSQIQHKSSSVEFDFKAKYQQIGRVNSSYQEIQIKDVNGNVKNFQKKNTSGNDNSCLLHAIISTVNGLGVPSNFRINYPDDYITKYARYLRDQMIKEWQNRDQENGILQDNKSQYAMLMKENLSLLRCVDMPISDAQIMNILTNNEMLENVYVWLLLYMIEKNTGQKWRVVICSDSNGIVEIPAYTEDVKDQKDKIECSHTIFIHHNSWINPGTNEQSGHFSAYEEVNTKAK